MQVCLNAGPQPLIWDILAKWQTYIVDFSRTFLVNVNQIWHKLSLEMFVHMMDNVSLQ